MARRKLADATAVQLTRYPGALAQAYRTLAGLDMKVPGAVAVHFLFPVWDPAVYHGQTQPDVTNVLMHMQLPFEPRLRRLERLGASRMVRRCRSRTRGTPGARSPPP